MVRGSWVLLLLLVALACNEQDFKPTPACGDGTVNLDTEECDDGNLEPGDGCAEDCTWEGSCGDGVLDDGEACDDGNLFAGDGCDDQCLQESCGDGVVQPGLGEECDDGNRDRGDGCDSFCLEEYCGDGVLQPALGEECDDSNDRSGDGCSSECIEEYCGDGLVQEDLGEECDDGNATPGDGCDGCIEEYCGDGIHQPELGEECDDGNETPEDGCNECIEEYCGDGILQEELGELCDDGDSIDDDECSNACVPVSEDCPSGGVSVLDNPGFEDGIFDPWTSNSGATFVTIDSYDGSWAAETEGNYYVRQDLLSPAPVASLYTASFWTWHDDDSAAQSIEWGYSDGSADSTLLFGDELIGWVQVDLLPLLDLSKDLSWIQVWGYSGGGALVDITRYDQFEFCEI